MQRRLCVWLLSLMVGALAGWATWTNAVLLWPASSVSAAALLGKLRAEPRFARLPGACFRLFPTFFVGFGSGS